MKLPTALETQACSISKSVRTVRIDCEDGDEANEVFDWLCNLVAAAQGIETA